MSAKLSQACSGDIINMQVTAVPAAKHDLMNGFHCQASPSSAACASHEAAERIEVQTHLTGHSQVRRDDELAERSAAPLSAGQPCAAAPAAAGQAWTSLTGCARVTLSTAGARPAAAEGKTLGDSGTGGGQVPIQAVLLPNGSVSVAESSNGEGAIGGSVKGEQQWKSSSQRVHVPHEKSTNGNGKAQVIKRRDRQRPASGGAAQTGSEVADQQAKRRANSCPEPPAKKSKCQEAFTLPDYGSSSSCSQDVASSTPEQGAYSKAEACSSEQMSVQNEEPSESAAAPQPADIRPGPLGVGQALQAAATPGRPPAEPLHGLHSQQAALTGLEEAHAAAQLPSNGVYADEDTVMTEACHVPMSLRADVALIHSIGAPTADSLSAGAAAARDRRKASRFTAQEPSSPELTGSQSPMAVPSAAVQQPVAGDPGFAPAAPEQAHASAMENVTSVSAASAAPAAELETGAALEDALEFPGVDSEGAVASEGSPLCPAPGSSADTEASLPAADTKADAAAAAVAAAAGQQPGGAAADQCLHESTHMGLAAHPEFTDDSSDAIPQEPMVVALRSDGTQICMTGVRCSFLLTPRHLHEWPALNNQMPPADDVLEVSCEAHASL